MSDTHSESTSDSVDGSQYTKVSHEEHVMIAPDTYVGSIEPEEVETFVTFVRK